MTDESTNERSETIEARMLEASRLAEEGEEGEALQMLFDLERDHPENPAVLCMIGAVAAQLGAEGIAGDFFRRCLALRPMDPSILVSAGAGLAAIGDPEAEPALRLAAMTAPEMPSARMEYGAYLAREGLLQDGLEHLRAARDLDPDSPVVRRELGIGYLLAGDVRQALDELETALSLDSEDPDLRMLFGLVLLQEGEIARAAEELHPLGTALPDDGEVQLILALVSSLEEWEDQAWLALSRAESTQHLARALVREAEEAIENGAEAVRDLLLGEIAPSALRDRIFRAR